ncbi:MAG: hypothetical protein IT536_08290 [Hyphomicrobiales bacterium]|nr:hypothetical protein [Hyphomicrobiales bacterium]
MTTIKYPNVTVQLTGQDGNAFTVLGLMLRAMRKANIPADEIAAFRTEATSGDYNTLLATCMKYVDVH